MRSILDKKKSMTIGDMYPAVMTLVLIGIVLGIGLYVLAETADNIDDTTASNAINETITSLSDFAGWIAVIVVVVAAAIVLGIVVRSFGTGARGM